MTLSPRVGGATTKPTDVSPSPAGQRFASNSCVTTKMTYEFFNELIENFTIAQASYAVTNVPNDANALNKLLNSVRTGGYAFTTSAINTSNSNITLGTGKLFFGADDSLEFNDATNEYSLKADGSIANSKLNIGEIKLDSLKTNTIVENTTGTGVTIEGVLIKNLVITSPQVISAKVLFNGTGTVAILKSFNVSSVDDLGVGVYRINFTNPYADINYCAVQSINFGGDTFPMSYIQQRNTNNLTIICKNFNGDQFYLADPAEVCVIIA